jgi:hypothetical protein
MVSAYYLASTAFQNYLFKNIHEKNSFTKNHAPAIRIECLIRLRNASEHNS